MTDNSSWDERMLGEQLKILSELELDFDLVAIGFEVPEIDLLIDGLNTVPEADPDDHSPEIAESPITVAGDLWQLGKHRVRSALQCGHYGHVTGLGKVRHREFGMASGEMNTAEFTDFLL
ncbi:hypothetical protein [Tunturiibacter gelidiferens]|uniref:Uncharacterized protein n=1 Tax=Tunturiibacter gelidiferens TaxID=3069689 RepID=A0AAU7Z113_9BACT